MELRMLTSAAAPLPSGRWRDTGGQGYRQGYFTPLSLSAHSCLCLMHTGKPTPPPSPWLGLCHGGLSVAKYPLLHGHAQAR